METAANACCTVSRVLPVCVCVCARARVCVCVCVRARMYVYIYTSLCIPRRRRHRPAARLEHGRVDAVVSCAVSIRR